MGKLLKRETTESGRPELFETFDRMFDDWSKLVPFRRSLLGDEGWHTGQVIRVNEFRENGTLVIKAEMPGVDPDTDVEVTVAEGLLHIHAERKEEASTEEKGYVRKELRFGSFSRTLPVPAGVTESDVTATYADGILEIRVPVPAPEVTAPTKVTITKR